MLEIARNLIAEGNSLFVVSVLFLLFALAIMTVIKDVNMAKSLALLFVVLAIISTTVGISMIVNSSKILIKAIGG